MRHTHPVAAQAVQQDAQEAARRAAARVHGEHVLEGGERVLPQRQLLEGLAQVRPRLHARGVQRHAALEGGHLREQSFPGAG
jgi:hypothetical protein